MDTMTSSNGGASNIGNTGNTAVSTHETVPPPAPAAPTPGSARLSFPFPFRGRRGRPYVEPGDDRSARRGG